MDYTPDDWKRYNFTPGILLLLAGGTGYIGSIYVIFLIHSTWLSWSLGSAMLAMSVTVIILGYNSLQKQQRRRTRLFTNRLHNIHASTSSGSGPLIPRNESDH